MTPEKNDKKLTRWLLIATIALLVLVLCVQLWQLFGGKKYEGPNGSLVPDSANGPAAPPQTAEPSNSPADSVSPGKTAMIEDVRSLNPDLSFDALSALSAEELEQLYETGAPGLPIGVSAAAQAAETYAGTLEIDSVTSETDPELDETPAHYEVELRHPTFGDFEYKIDAYTGQVLEGAPNILQSRNVPDPGQEIPASGSEKAPAAPASQTPAAQTPAAPQKPAPDTQAPPSNAQTSTRQPAATGEEAAKNAAFAHAGVSAASASVTKCKLDWEDGRQIYEIEFWADGIEYDYEIDAATGAVLKAGQEWGGAASGGSGLIGEEAAKSAALAHAGVSAADATGLRCELDEDGGRWVYEIEFRAGGVEYEYEIAAADGTVLKAEQDR